MSKAIRICAGLSAAVAAIAGAGAARADVVPVGARPVTPFASGTSHACAVVADGTVRCWGSDAFGQLGTVRLPFGDRSLIDAPLPPPTQHTSCSDPSMCDAPYYTCVGGQCVPVPQPVPSQPDLAHVIGLAAGDSHTCAILDDGTVRCWGDNSAGQLGDGSFGPSSTPVAVTGIGGGAGPGAIAIAAGSFHTCALLANGAVSCWGDDNWGQLGAGPAGPRSNVPVAVQGLAGAAIAVTAGSDHACALLGDGSVACWGSNASGQLGDGTTNPHATAAPAHNIGAGTHYRAVAIAAGRLHTCALALYSSGSTNKSQVLCWGYGAMGELGQGNNWSLQTPTAVPNLTNVRAIAANGDHTCATLASGTLQCWGDNSTGQIGDGTSGGAETPAPVQANQTRPSPTAVPIPNAPPVRLVSPGWFHTCAVLADGTATCWGNDRHGQLGDSLLAERDAPDVTKPVAGLSGSTVVANGDPTDGQCIVLPNGTVKCWGNNQYGMVGDLSTTPAPTPVLVNNVTHPFGNALSVCQGEDFSCALLADGTAQCWGGNYAGQLGYGSAPDSAAHSQPSGVLGLTNAVAIACGQAFACALLADGTLQCWGDNDEFQLGNASPQVLQTAPTTVVGPDGVTPFGQNRFIAAGAYHTCAVHGDGTTQCWGESAYGQLGDNDVCSNDPGCPMNWYPEPAQLPSSPAAKSLALGDYHTCALLADGTARCWGRDQDGELGNGATSDSAVPVTVAGLSGAVAIAAGGGDSCATMADGTLRCWGSNLSGELADGTNTQRDTPVVSAPTHVASVTTGGCATLTDGTAVCWGERTADESPAALADIP